MLPLLHTEPTMQFSNARHLPIKSELAAMLRTLLVRMRELDVGISAERLNYCALL